MIPRALWRRSLPRYLAALSSFSAADMVDNNSDGAVPNSNLRRHRKFWLDDGSLIVRAQDDLYKVHRTLLTRHSSRLASLVDGTPHDTSDTAVCPTVHIPEGVGLESTNFEALLEHLYHDTPISDGSFRHVAGVLRASSKKQLDLPSVHNQARQKLESLFPSVPVPYFHSDDADKALTLAVEYEIPSIQKALYYSLATNSNLEHDDPDGPSSRPTSPAPVRPDLSPELAARCRTLLDQLVAHFTPVLFTVATAHHMACTNVFAEAWMPLVIQPALEGSGLCRPLETLQTIMDLDWAAHGLCADCVRDKREEWKGEQQAVWDAMDDWLGLRRSGGDNGTT
ncbi:hypothetical protein OBBRIDRAFT_751737 [Obba rivulosa]|uniref:BTB domain-containing protein n=1 Tax=Obba rivulosa TaxID=1052685 RepID=A0A8E2AXB0_9APHY|nr:hypothetical protein OBBRIDRAFT_751737 [Obba rivulosa]